MFSIKFFISNYSYSTILYLYMTKLNKKLFNLVLNETCLKVESQLY